MFSEIIPQLYLCGALEANSTYFVNNYRPKVIINVDQEPNYILDHRIRYYHIPFEDDYEGNTIDLFHHTIRLIRKCYRQHQRPIFLHCAAGISRSPSLMALYLWTYKPKTFLTLESAMNFIRSKHAVTHYHSNVLRFIHDHVISKQRRNHD